MFFSYYKDALKKKLERKVMVTFLSFKPCSAIIIPHRISLRSVPSISVEYHLLLSPHPFCNRWSPTLADTTPACLRFPGS